MKRYSYLKLFDNAQKIVPVALNIGIKNSRGKYILRADAHSIYGKNYTKKCAEYLNKIDADCIGGVLETLSSNNSFVAKTITLVLSYPFGAGGKTFRTKRGSSFVDTVPFGAYRKEIFNKMGLFNEKLIRNQDIEFNSRIRKLGRKIYITPEIKVSYLGRRILKN